MTIMTHNNILLSDVVIIQEIEQYTNIYTYYSIIIIDNKTMWITNVKKNKKINLI